MGTTPKYAIPYIEPADLLANYPVQDKAQADRLEAMWDTPWTAFATALTSGTSRYRVIGSIVFVQVDGSFTSTSGTSHTLTVAPLPTAIRPTLITRATGYFSLYSGVLSINVGGDLTAVQQSGANRTSVSGIVIYPLG